MFTPSVLTILGVIMYLRLPAVVGNAGLTAALGIILVAHVISISTGLSISSIATDKNVGCPTPLGLQRFGYRPSTSSSVAEAVVRRLGS